MQKDWYQFLAGAHQLHKESNLFQEGVTTRSHRSVASYSGEIPSYSSSSRRELHQ